MTHPRQVIRAETVARLRTLPGLAARVFPGRLLPLAKAALPAVCVYTLRNTAQSRGAQTQPMFHDTTTLAVELYVAAVPGTEDPEDALDDLAEQVEERLLGDPTWLVACGGARVEAIETAYRASAQGEGPFLAAQLAFALQHRTTFPPRLETAFAGLSLAVAPIEPRDLSQPFPPADWRLSPFARIDLPQD